MTRVDKIPPALQIGDSSVVALRASQAVLLGRHFDAFSHPPFVRLLARLVNRLPLESRLRVMDWVCASLGSEPSEFQKIDPQKLAEWATSGYPLEKYDGCILGAPANAVAFLAGITGYPFLPQPFLHDARFYVEPDNGFAHLQRGKELAEPLLARYSDIEAIIHFDPVHDRFLIRRIIFIRLKYLRLPAPYREFLERRLTPHANVILLDCRYRWLLAEVSERLYFQLGGLGGFSPQDYLDEIQPLKDYRRKWRGDDTASWKVDLSFLEAPESEWATTGDFLDEAEEISLKLGYNVIRFRHDHPVKLSIAVKGLYETCFKGAHPPKNVYISTFTSLDPLFPLITGAIPIWLPFITQDNLEFATSILEERSKTYTAEGTGWLSLHPSFCFPPDIVPIELWMKLLRTHFKNVKLLGTNPDKYPADFDSYVSLYPSAKRVARAYRFPHEPFSKPTDSQLRAFLGG